MYLLNGLIEASDYNTLKNQANLVYGVGTGDHGYGQTGVTLSNVTQFVSIIQSVQWTNLRTALQACLSHQGSNLTLPVVTEFNVNALVKAYSVFVSGCASLSPNRFLFGPAATTVFANQSNSSRNTAWTTQIAHEFNVTFPTANDARYFFNSGGSISLRPTRTGGSATIQNQAWTDFVTWASGFTISAHTCSNFNNRGTTQNKGYYELPVNGAPTVGGGYAMLYEIFNNAPTYGGSIFPTNNIRIYGASLNGPQGANGDNGSQLRFRIEFNDANVTIPDSVDGTFTSAVDYRKATNPLVIATPVFANVVLMSAGS